MSDNTVRVELSNDNDRPATAEELTNVPAMTQADCMEIMRSPEYKTIRRVREITAAALAKSDFGSPVEARFDGSRPVEEGYQPMNEIQAKQATIQRLFNDPRYKRDAAYRYEVQQRVAELTVNDNFDTLSGQPLTGSLRPVDRTGEGFSVLSKQRDHLEPYPAMSLTGEVVELCQ